MKMEEALEKLFTEKGIPYRANRQSFILERCPKCSGEKCYVRRRDGRSICFSGGCGSKWDWKGLISSLFGVPIKDTMRLLFGFDSSKEVELGLVLDFNDSDDDEITEEQEDLPKPIALGFDFLPVEKSEVGINYLIERKIVDPSLVAAYDIRYQPLMNAIVFPIRRDGILYGWQARSIPPLREGQPRMITSPGFSKAKFLLNWDRAKLEDNIILTEGPVDCIHADLPGYGAVASFGKSVSRSQVDLLLGSKAKRIYLGLDRDAANEVSGLVKLLCPTKEVYRLYPPDHRKDLGECTAEEVLKCIEVAEKCEGYQSKRIEVYLKS